MNCPVCLDSFNSSTRQPLIVCINNHSVCNTCTTQLETCPFCRSSILSNPQPNRDLVEAISCIDKGESSVSICSSQISGVSQKKLGSGGFGSVYGASWMGSDIAIKLVDLTEEGKRRLYREIACISRLNHPHVVRVFGVCELDERIGIIMERGDGCLPIPSVFSKQTLKYAVDIVNAVKFLHSKQVVHGDLKPANILLVDNKIKLTDFGTARTISSLTLNPSVLATTPKYAAPESFDGKCGPQSDVYSIGIILYEILCNKIAFQKDSINTLLKKKFQNFIPPFNDSDHPELKKLITQCLTRNQHERPLLDDILRVLAVFTENTSVSTMHLNTKCSNEDLNSNNSEVSVTQVVVQAPSNTPCQLNSETQHTQQLSPHLSSNLFISSAFNTVPPQTTYIASPSPSPRQINAQEAQYLEMNLLSLRDQLQNKPGDPDVLNEIGMVFVHLNRFQEALDSFDSALKSHAYHFTAHANRSNLLQRISNPNGVVAPFQASISSPFSHSPLPLAAPVTLSTSSSSYVSPPKFLRSDEQRKKRRSESNSSVHRNFNTERIDSMKASCLKLKQELQYNEALKLCDSILLINPFDDSARREKNELMILIDKIVSQRKVFVPTPGYDVMTGSRHSKS
ncbi:hypothetical protein RCL1_007990 [Eukaryota sp. TZLM3-RCL]